MITFDWRLEISPVPIYCVFKNSWEDDDNEALPAFLIQPLHALAKHPHPHLQKYKWYDNYWRPLGQKLWLINTEQAYYTKISILIYRYLQPHDGEGVIEIDSEAKWFGDALDHCRPLKHHLAGSPAALSRIAKRQKNWPNSGEKIAFFLTILGHKEVSQVDLSSAGYHARTATGS